MAVVEIFFALQQRVHLGEERAGLRALNDAVIVGAGDHQRLANAEIGAHLFADGGELGGKIDGADGDDCALAGHETRNGADGADGARIGERNGGAFEIGDLQFVGAGARNDVVIGGDELGESHAVGMFNVGDFESARTVFGGDIDS